MAIKIDIKQFELENTKIKNLKIYIRLNIFNKFDIIKIKIDKTKLNKLLSKNTPKMDLSMIKIEKIKELIKNIQVEKIIIISKIGTENPIITSFIVATLASILAILFAKIKKPSYKIEQVYTNKNYLYLNINCIFKVKLVHIINISKKLKKKGVVPKYGNTSNRRAYAYSNG